MLLIRFMFEIPVRSVRSLGSLESADLFCFFFHLTTSSVSVCRCVHTPAAPSALQTAAVVKTNRCAQHSSAVLRPPRRRGRCGCYCLKGSSSWLCGGANLPPGSINLHRDGEFLAPAQVAGPAKESRAPSPFAGSVGLVWSGCGALALGCRSERPHGRQR